MLYTEPPESLEHISDQAALPNLNAEWVNAKGISIRRYHTALRGQRDDSGLVSLTGVTINLEY